MSANVDLDAKRLVPLKAWGRCRGCWSSSSSYPRSKMVWQWRRLRSSSASFSESLGRQRWAWSLWWGGGALEELAWPVPVKSAQAFHVDLATGDLGFVEWLLECAT